MIRPVIKRWSKADGFGKDIRLDVLIPSRPCGRLLVILIPLLLVLGGCGPEMDEGAVVIVNGRQIKTEKLVRAAGLRSGLAAITGEERAVVLEILEQMINEELILAEAEKRGLTVTRAELEARIAEIRRDYPGSSFDEMLVKEYVLFDEWKEGVRRSLLIKKAVETEYGAQLALEPEELKALAEVYKSELTHPALYKVSYLTFKSRAGARSVLTRMRNGRDFDQAARENQAEAPKISGFLDPRELPPAMSEAIVKTKVGEVSEVVETSYGYSIFKVVAMQPSRPMTPEETEAYLRRRYVNTREDQLHARWVQELKQKAAITYSPDLLRIIEPDQ